MFGSYVIVFSCKGFVLVWEGGILVLFENGLVIDIFWKCIMIVRYGWNMRIYWDDDWFMVSFYGDNNKLILFWGEILSIDDKVVWIWFLDNKKDIEVYCWYSFVVLCIEGML